MADLDFILSQIKSGISVPGIINSNSTRQATSDISQLYKTRKFVVTVPDELEMQRQLIAERNYGLANVLNAIVEVRVKHYDGLAARRLKQDNPHKKLNDVYALLLKTASYLHKPKKEKVAHVQKFSEYAYSVLRDAVKRHENREIDQKALKFVADTLSVLIADFQSQPYGRRLKLRKEYDALLSLTNSYLEGKGQLPEVK